MKRNSIFKSVICIFVAVLMVTITPVVSAHMTSHEGILAGYYYYDADGDAHYCIGGEDVGWSIDEYYHTNGTNLTYSFSNSDPYLTDTYAYKSYVTNGASRWSGTVTIVNKTDGSGTGLICTHEDANTVRLARFFDVTVDPYRHFDSWTISMNRMAPLSPAILAHEFGHAIGLVDLYADQNSNKLMYQYIGDTNVSMPTALDKWGAKVITGVHTSHTWGYKYHSTTTSGNNRHVNYCTGCNGFPVQKVIANCVYNANNVCRLCGTPAGSQPWSLRHETK